MSSKREIAEISNCGMWREMWKETEQFGTWFKKPILFNNNNWNKQLRSGAPELNLGFNMVHQQSDEQECKHKNNKRQTAGELTMHQISGLQST
jgi:hypothetical protein